MKNGIKRVAGNTNFNRQSGRLLGTGPPRNVRMAAGLVSTSTQIAGEKKVLISNPDKFLRRRRKRAKVKLRGGKKQ